MPTLVDCSSESGGFYPSWESDFREKSSAAAANIKKIEQNAEELNIHLIRRPLRSSSKKSSNTVINKDGAGQEELQLQKETATLAQETKVLMHEMRRYLTENKDNRAARIQFDRLADNFATALHEFQQYQRDLITRERTKRGSSNSTEAMQLEQTLGSGDAVDQNDQDLIQTQKLINIDQQSFAIQVDALEDRQHAVQSLEREIRDVNDIFRDLAMLVHEQGDVIDNIEASIETGDLNLTAGLDELERARRKANRSRARKMMCYGVAGIFVVLLILSVSFGSMS